jgi:hypothetical protein
MNERILTEDGELLTRVDLKRLRQEEYERGLQKGERKAAEILERDRIKQSNIAARNRNYALIAEAKNNKKSFLQLNEGNGRAMLKGLSLMDAGALFILMTNISLESEGLLASEGKNGKPKPLKKSELMKLVGKSKNGFDSVVERLENIGAIIVDRSKRTYRYSISEELVNYGSRKSNDNFTKVYRTKAKALFKKLSDREAGAIFKCMPYVHHRTQALVFNAHEEDLSKVQPIRGNDLAELLGLEYESLTNLTSKLKRKGALMFVDVGTEGKGYVLNPYLADRGFNTEYTDRARAYFSIFEDKKSGNRSVKKCDMK